MQAKLYSANDARTLPIPSRDGSYFHFVKIWENAKHAVCTSPECGAARRGRPCHAVKTALKLIEPSTVPETHEVFTDAETDEIKIKRIEIAQMRKGVAFLRSQTEVDAGRSADALERAAAYFEYLLDKETGALDDPYDLPGREEDEVGPQRLAPAPPARFAESDFEDGSDLDPFAPMQRRDFAFYHAHLAL